MFQKIKQHPPFFIKFISVFICVTLIIGIAPTSVLSNLWVSAAEEPQYGHYDVSDDGKTLTAVPNEGAAFRGWYKDGKEVSYKSKITLSNGENSSDYKAVFYNFNLANNPGFENQNEVWQGTAVYATSNEQRKSGLNSLKISGSSNTNYVYKSFSDLEIDTQYTLSYYYKGDSLSGFVVGGNSVSSSDFYNNTYNGKYLAKNNGALESSWKEAKLTFYTKNNTTVSLLLNLPENGTVYVDDVCLVKDVMAKPTYFNEDFSNGCKNVFVNQNGDLKNPNFELSIDEKDQNKRLMVKQNIMFGDAQFLPIKMKKGANYTITFKLDMSDESLNADTVQGTDGRDYDNFINFSLTETEGSFGSNSKPNEWIIGPDDATPTGKLFTATISDGKNKVNRQYYLKDTGYTDHSAIGFPKSFLTDNKFNVSDLTVTMEVTAVKTCVAYLTARLNGRGIYYIDELTVTEDSTSANTIDIASNSAIKTIGTAIRTVGTQGMRYKTQIDKRLLTADNGYGIRVIEYGTVAIRTAILDNKELIIGQEYTNPQNGKKYEPKVGPAYSLSVGVDNVYKDKQTTIDFTGVLINISQGRWNEDYTARAYFKYVDKNGNTDTFYLDPSLIAVYPISKAAYSARDDEGEFVETESVRDYLYEKILSKFTDKTVKVSDNSTIYNNFQGIRSTVYHGTIFFPDSHGRTYTESQAEVEMERLVDSKVDNVRTRFDSNWMWEDGQGWNWQSTKMKKFYEWAKMLQDRNISITLNAGWHLHDFSFFYDTLVAPAGNRKGYEAAYGDKDGNGHSSIPEVNYLHGYQTPSSEYTKGQLEINCDEKGNIINDKGSAFKYENKYGEDSLAPTLTQIGKDLNLFKEGETYDESKYAYFSVAAARYAVWIKQALNAFKANGVNNVKYVLPFTETGYAINMGKDKEGNTIYANDFTYDEWIFMTAALNYVLQDENPTYGGAYFGGNIRNQYKIIGPSQSIEPSSTSRISLVTHIYNKLNAAKNSGKFSGNLEFLNTSPLVNINSMHCYPKPDTKSDEFKNNGYTNSIFDPYATYSMADNNFRGYSDILKGSGVRDMEFWCDEYFAGAPDSKHYQNVGMQMTQFAAGLTAGINNGINRFSTWQMFDTLWDSDAIHGDCINTGSSEFAGGIHVCGTCPSLVHVDGKTCPSGSNCPCTKNYPISSYVPRTTYYGINLIGKYMNNNNAKVFGTQVQNQYGDGDGGVYVSAIENDEGKTVVLVVNTMPTTSSVNLEFDKEYTNFTRYTYDPNEVVPTKDATSLPSDKTITMENPKSFYDIIPAQSFAIYVEVKNEIYIGEDVDIEVD